MDMITIRSKSKQTNGVHNEYLISPRIRMEVNLTPTNDLLLRNNTRSLGKLNSVVIASLMVFVISLSLLLAGCEQGFHLVVENQLSSDVTIIHEGIKKDGTYAEPQVLMTVPFGKTVKMDKSLLLRPASIGYTVILKAEDPSGKVVWEKSWPYEEFKKLEDVDWKIIIEPQ